MDAHLNLENCDAEEENTRARIREELAEMSFAELQGLKEKIGTKMFNKTLHKDEVLPQNFQRENKNRPRELSSKRTVTRFREVIPIKSKITRDPRFDDLSGTFSERVFSRSYAFIKDIKAKEKEQLQQEMKDETDNERKKKIKSLLKRMENQEKDEKLKQIKEEKKAEQRKEAIAQLRSGQKPFFVKKSASRKIELAEKFEQLKKNNKIDKYLIRKRKKNVKKERKSQPVQK